MSLLAPMLFGLVLCAAPSDDGSPDGVASPADVSAGGHDAPDDVEAVSNDGSPEESDADAAGDSDASASDPNEPETDEPGSDESDESAARSADDDELLFVATGARTQGPPWYTEDDEAKLRARYGLDPEVPEQPPGAKWRCLIADTSCGISFEVNATSAYAHRLRQGDVREAGALNWHSARVQYDLWLNLPVLVETVGNARHTRFTMGPKGGVVFSDSGDLWGNFGIAARYWLGRGRWAPSIEFTSAITYKMGGRPTRTVYDASGTPIEPQFRMMRGPAGFSADVGFGLGGFGALIIGGQYDSPLAREDIPEIYRTPAAGMFFVGFRGNILWGGPAGAAVLTHVLAQRFAGP